MKSKPFSKNLNTQRSASRLAAVQALYQIEFGGSTAGAVIQEFIDRRLGAKIDGDQYAEADHNFFRLVVSGEMGQREEIDKLLQNSLGDKHSLTKMDGILRALLRAATFELLMQKDIPMRVILDEYMNVAHAFYSGPEPKLVNGVLDNLAHHVRSEKL